MRAIARIFTVTFALALLASQAAFGQETDARRSLYDDSGRLVYVLSAKVAWPRVDSLLQLESIFNAVTEAGIEMGCYADRQMLIHHTGSEYNVVYKTYRDEFRWPDPDPGCGGRALRAVVPDSAQRAARSAGLDWVYEGTGGEHRDEIFWEPYPKQ